MPLHVLFLAAALAAASPSFAVAAAPSRDARAAAPAPGIQLATAFSSSIGNGTSALASDFPDLGPIVPAAPPAAPAGKPASADRKPASGKKVSEPAPAAAEALTTPAVAAPAEEATAPKAAPSPKPAAAASEAPDAPGAEPAEVVIEPIAPAEEPAAEEQGKEVAAPAANVAPVAAAPKLPVLLVPAAAPVAATSPVTAPAQVVSAPPAAAPAVLPPKIIDVPGEDEAEDDGPHHHTADREKLLREFPDALVESMWIQDWQDIERLHQYGRLVDVASDPEGRGIILRLEGGSRIGELEDDPYRQMLLCRLAKPAAGLLYRIASRLRLIEGEAYEPLQITSLVRTWDYQLRLTDVNPNADRTREGVPPTHVLGLAFDIARSQMSYERQQRIEFLFDQLARDGELAYYKEGAMNGLMHYHVIALPSADLQLARYYERESQAVERQEAAVARHRTMPDAPCVMFGSSLEPFSAICSCELPLEASASPYLADAPVSR